MAFTREFIRRAARESGVEIPKEFEDALVSEHLSARDAYAEGQVKDALEKNKPADVPNVKDTEEYKKLRQEFDDYRAEVSGREAKAAKERAARAFFEGKGITGKSLDIAIRGCGAEIDALELEDGKIKDDTALDALVKDTYSGLVSTTVTRGAQTANPPVNNGAAKTKEQIMGIKDTAERQREIAQNLDLFQTNE